MNWCAESFCEMNYLGKAQHVRGLMVVCQTKIDCDWSVLGWIALEHWKMSNADKSFITAFIGIHKHLCSAFRQEWGSHNSKSNRTFIRFIDWNCRIPTNYFENQSHYLYDSHTTGSNEQNKQINQSKTHYSAPCPRTQLAVFDKLMETHPENIDSLQFN